MRNYLCWDPRSVRQVINPYAEHIPDGLFRAVHSDWDLTVSPPVGKSFQAITEAAWNKLTPSEFLDDFLREERPHALAAILGATGSGKSHLVHWMRLNIKPDEKRFVLVVPKSGTSLRAIVQMIIKKLPEDQQQSFLDTLQSAGDGSQSRSDQKQQLLNDLAQVIREEELLPNADEIEQELVLRLPHLFQDPHMRATHFLADNTVITQIVDHIFAPSNARDRPEKRRNFVESDLPLGGMDFANASKHARDAIQIIDLEPAVYRPLAIRIINRNLDRAVARTLSFSADRVEELMSQLRIHLKQLGKELVLLVEEFARLQGIDRALLQAITTHGDHNHCKMRSAIAVTTGFFESVAETAYTRTTHIVDMNRSAGRSAGQNVTKESLSQFTSRYLNAVRIGPEGINHWNKSATPGEDPPSACATCQNQGECHTIFGAVDGYGVYPFTPDALWNSASRVDEWMPASLNPRVLQNDLLVEILDNFGESISTGEFPPFHLLEKLGGVQALSLTAQTELQNRNPQNSPRWAAFLELYDGTGQVKNLNVPLRDAFNVPEIPGAAEEQSNERNNKGENIDEPRSPPANHKDMAIQEWINGRLLDQTVAGELRPLIFSAVADGVDWDMLGLAKTAFVGRTGRDFQPNSISFDRQSTQVQEHLRVKIRIPGDLVKPATAGAALQGLLRASKKGFSWNFENGEKMLAAFLDCVEAWTENVEEQLYKICAPSPEWIQADGALELLCVGAAIGGKIKPYSHIADMIDGAFCTWPTECGSTSQEMRKLYAKLLTLREEIARMARARISSMKGGVVGSMLNPRRTHGAFRNIRKSKWRLRLEPPANDRSKLAKLYRETKVELESAAVAEMSIRQQWLNDMESAFGPEATRTNIAASLEGVRQAALSAGIGSNKTSNRLSDALDSFARVQFDDSILAVRTLAMQNDVLAALPHFGRGRRNAIEAGVALSSTAKNFLDAVGHNLEMHRQNRDAEFSAIERSITTIVRSLDTIEVEIVQMGSLAGENLSAT